jgi:hypothetical protein
VAHREDATRVEGLRHRVVIGDELLEGAQQPVRGRGSARVRVRVQDRDRVRVRPAAAPSQGEAHTCA